MDALLWAEVVVNDIEAVIGHQRARWLYRNRSMECAADFIALNRHAHGPEVNDGLRGEVRQIGAGCELPIHLINDRLQLTLLTAHGGVDAGFPEQGHRSKGHRAGNGDGKHDF